MISQVYGAGGNAGATFNADYVEIFNPGNNAVSLSGWSIQYASASGTSWSKTDLAGNIDAGRFFLVQLSATGANGSPLPAPDHIVTPGINMASASGKVVLVNHNNTISGCPVSYVDLVGYGTSNCFEGSGACPSLSASLAGIRQNSACTDNNNNATDFISTTPLPRNSSSPPVLCSLLPITWGEIFVVQENNNVKIDWENLDASAVTFFEIQRAQQNQTFTSIGKVYPSNNDRYQFRDKKPIPGLIQYRILAIETTGDTSTSKIILVLVPKTLELTLHPNPARNVLHILCPMFSNDITTIKILSVNGNVMCSKTINTNDGEVSMNIEKLPPGIYNVSIENGSQRVRRMFVKQ